MKKNCKNMTSKKIKKTSTSLWFFIHILFPLLPFILEGFIKWFANGFSTINNTFNSSTLAWSLVMLSLFIYQSLLTDTSILPDNYEKDSKKSIAFLFLIYALITSIIYGFLIYISSDLEINTNPLKKNQLLFLNLFIYLFWWLLPIITSIPLQKSFKLRTAI